MNTTKNSASSSKVRQRRTKAHIIFRLVPWLGIILMACVWLVNPPFIALLKFKAFDMYQSTWPRETPPDFPVVVIDIDEKSLKELGQWPWPRPVLAELVEKTFAQGVTAMGFDVVFAEVDRTSPRQNATLWPLSPEAQMEIKTLPDHDTVFARALSKHPVVLGYALNPNARNVPEDDFDVYSDVTGTELDTLRVPEVSGLVRNLNVLENAAPSLGWFAYIPSFDNIIRQVPLIVRYQDALFAPLAIKILREHSQAKTLEPIRGSHGALKGVTFGDYTAPTNANGQFWLRFRPFSKAHYVSAADVIAGNIPPHMLQGKMAIVGYSASGLLDMRATPLAANVPGVDIHIQLIENILTGDYLQRPQWLGTAEIILATLLAVLMLITLNRTGPLFGAMAATVFVSANLAFSVYMFRNHGWLIDPILPFISQTTIYLVANVLKYAQELAAKRAIRGAFSHYLAPAMVEILAKDSDQLKLGGETKEMSILFSDIRDFTAISERMAPDALTALLNRYLTPMTEVIQHNSGTIDKYMGDAIMAFWNAPLDVSNHAYLSCRSALMMHSQLTALNTQWRKERLPMLKTGIGISTGSMTVGNMGSDQRFNYTVIGDSVNLASRLEGLTKYYGVPIVISEYTAAQVPQAQLMPLDLVIVKGKTEPVAVCALLGLKGDIPAKRAELADAALMHNGVDAFRNRKFAEAADYFRQLKHFPVLQALYLERVAYYQKNPPPTNWSGAVERREK